LVIRAGDFEPTSPQPQYPEKFAGYCVTGCAAAGNNNSASAKGRKGQITSSGHGPNGRASSDGNASAPTGHASSGATAHPTRVQGRPCNPGAAARSAQPVQSRTPPQRSNLQPLSQTLSATCVSPFGASLVAHGRQIFALVACAKAFATLRRNLENTTNQNVHTDHNKKWQGHI
jgi:hypothetical protein